MVNTDKNLGGGSELCGCFATLPLGHLTGEHVASATPKFRNAKPHISPKRTLSAISAINLSNLKTKREFL